MSDENQRALLEKFTIDFLLLLSGDICFLLLIEFVQENKTIITKFNDLI